METFWYIAVGFMMAMFIMLDGFDFGAGIVYFRVGRTNAERTRILDAIGPVWNGNEVWLIAGGGLLFFAFPKVYASAFSGFYLALIGVLWLLMLRGLAIELRHHMQHPLWIPIWDVTFSVTSLLLAFVFGAALGNLTRGVPLNEDGYFFVPFWASFFPGDTGELGILDAWTVTKGLLTTALLAVHGANYIAMKTDGAMRDRASRLAKRGGWLLFIILFINIFTFESAHPALWDNFNERPMGWILVVAAVGAFAAMLYFRHKERDVRAFAASSVYILLNLAVAGWVYYPNMLISPTHPEHNLTIYNSSTSPYAMEVGMYWFAVAITLIMIYTVAMHRAFWGKVPMPPEDGEHH
jgi:cytochrome d ubiquinol oxidase subunit II